MNQIMDFAEGCVEKYATFDGCDGCYTLDVYELPDFVQHEFAAMLIGNDESLAVEATGPDNKKWDSKMLPALTRYLKNSTDKDEQAEFNRIWIECITSHLANQMQSLIDDCMTDFNFDHGYRFSSSKYYGIASHGPI